jgi:hypothetical protein
MQKVKSRKYTWDEVCEICKQIYKDTKKGYI